MKSLGASPANRWLVSPDLVDTTRPVPPPRLTAKPQDVVSAAGRRSLGVSDMQNGFCTPVDWLDHIGVDVQPARAQIAPLQALLPALRGAELPVIQVNWGNRSGRLNLSPALLHLHKPAGEGALEAALEWMAALREVRFAGGASLCRWLLNDSAEPATPGRFEGSSR